VPLGCSFVVLTIVGQGLLGLVLYVILLAPSYVALLYYFRTQLGIERFLASRKGGGKGAGTRSALAHQLSIQGENTMSKLSATTDAPAVSLREQLHRVWRHKMIVIITIVVCTLIAVAFSFLAPPKYTAKSSVLVNPLVTDPAAGGNANSLKVDISTESRAAGSREVADKAADNLRSEGVDTDSKLTDKLMNSTKVVPTSQTAVLDIEVSDSNAKRSAQYANAIAKAYLEVRQNNLKETITDSVKKLDTQIKQLEDEDKNNNGNANSAKISQMRERRNQIQLTSTVGGRVLTEAQPPKKATGLGHRKTALAGVGTGLLLGVLIAYVYDRMMRTVGYSDRLKDLGIPVQTVRPRSSDEDTLLLMRRIGSPDGNLRASNISGIVIVSDSPALADQLHRQLYRTIPSGKAYFTDYPALSKVLEHYSPEQVIESNEIPMVINLADEAPLSTLLRLSEACRVCLVPVGELSSRAQVRELFSHLRTLENTVSIAIFMDTDPEKEKVDGATA
jgi:putative chain length determinant protein